MNSWYFYLFLSIFILTSLFIGHLVFYLKINKELKYALPKEELLTLLVLLGFWSLCNAMTFSYFNMEIRIFFHELKYIGVCLSPVVLFLLVIKTFYKRPIKDWFLVLIFTFPILTILAVFTNSMHYLFRIQIYLSENLVMTENGPWFWWNTYYLYSMLIMSLMIAGYVFYKEPRFYKATSGLVIISIIIPFLFNGFYIFFLYDTIPVDATPLAFTTTVLILVYAEIFNRPYKIIPMARKMIVNNIGDGILLIDRNQVIIDVNKTFEKISGIKRHKMIGCPVEFIENKTINDLIHSQSEMADLDTYCFSIEGQERFFTFENEEITDHHQFIARLVSFKDVTEIKKSYESLEYSYTHDHVTGAYNRATFEKALEDRDKRIALRLVIVICDINGLRLINDAFGTEMGNRYLKKVFEIMSSILNNYGEINIYRIDGDSFCGIIHQDETVIQQLIDEIMIDTEKEKGFPFPMNISLGYAMRDPILLDPLSEVLKKANDMLFRKKLLEAGSNRYDIIHTLMTTLSERNIEDSRHMERTKELAIQLGSMCQLSELTLHELGLLALLHDIGKLTIPDAILLKPDRLNDQEWEIMKKHTIKGYHIANSSFELSSIAKSILCHHEKYDGTGYPRGLKGEMIPICARIVTLVDSYDAMTNDRVYQKAKTMDEAILELERCSGSQFDPEITKKFITLIRSESNK